MLFVVFLLTKCVFSSQIKYTGNEKLNNFIKELYLEIPENSSYKISDLRLAQVARRCVNEGYWIVAIKDNSNKIVAMFQANPNSYREHQAIIRLTERNYSGINGYAIVDWSVFPDNTNNFLFENDGLTQGAGNIYLSKNINKFVSSECLYVSSSEGDDSNFGIDKKHPLKSISLARLFPKNIKLKCGDVFYGPVRLSGVSMSSYGKGAKPILSGWKKLKHNEKQRYWQEGYLSDDKWIPKTGTHIWRLDLTLDIFEGCIQQFKFHNDIGLIINEKTREMYGRKCQYLYQERRNENPYSQTDTWLKNNFDFCQCSKKGNEKLTDVDFRYLYMYLDKDPNDLDLSFSTYATGVSVSNANVEGIRVEGFGCHGFGCLSNVRVENCDVEYIGGSQQVGYTQWVRFGNGVEFYISNSTKNGYVSDNRISHTFDCAATIQGANYDNAKATNIYIKNNMISNCRQAFEHFLNNKDTKNGGFVDYENCGFVNNVCYDIGDNGFSSPELRDACILSYESVGNKSIEISGNTFVGSNYYCGCNFSKKIFNNKLYLCDDQYLNYYHLKKNYKKMLADSESSIEAYRQLTKDNSEVIRIKRGTLSDLKKKLKLK